MTNHESESGIANSLVDFTPYKGLMPYTEEDAEFFFGRESCRDTIIDNLGAARLTILYGASGVGKSSILRAGVVRCLKDMVGVTPEGSKIAVVFFNDWHDDPLSGLRKLIENCTKDLLGPQREPDDPSLPFDEALAVWTKPMQDGRGRLFIILDQFEEYFLYQKRDSGKEKFADAFPCVVNNSELPVNFLISLRDDSLHKLDFFKKAIPKLLRNLLRVEHLDIASASDAIRKPIKVYNSLTAEGQPPVSIEPELIEAVLEDVRTDRRAPIWGKGQGGLDIGTEEFSERRIETPFLQLVMTRLWREEVRSISKGKVRTEPSRLKKSTLKRLGGAAEIVKEHLDARLNALKDDEQNAVAHMFKYLVTASGTKIALCVGDLVKWVNEESDSSLSLDEHKSGALLNRLSQGTSRILRNVTLDSDTSDRYEIYHDVLADAILDWRRRYLEEQKLRAQREAERKRSEEEKQREMERIERQALIEKTRLEERKRLILVAFLASAFVIIIYFSGSVWNMIIGNYLRAGNTALQGNAFEDAKSNFQKALYLDKGLAAAINGIGKVYIKEAKVTAADPRQKWEEANTKFIEAVNIAKNNKDPNLPGYQMDLAQSFLFLRKLDDAISYFASLKDTEPFRAEAYAGLGNCYAEKGEYGNAVTAYETAIKINRNDASLYLNLAGLQQKANSPLFEDNLREAESVAKNSGQPQPIEFWDLLNDLKKKGGQTH